LSSVLADNGRGSLDVSGIERGLIERRREEEDESIITPDEVSIHRRHGLGSARRIRGRRDHRPRLCDRIDAAFAACCRAERCAVIEVATPVPVAIPGVALLSISHGSGVLPPHRGAHRLTAAVSEGSKRRELSHRNQPSQTLSPFPSAFSARTMTSMATPSTTIQAALVMGNVARRIIVGPRIPQANARKRTALG
jgi:hypothetical protein